MAGPVRDQAGPPLNKFPHRACARKAACGMVVVPTTEGNKMNVYAIAIEYQVEPHAIEDIIDQQIADWNADLPADLEQIIRDAMDASADADEAMHEQ